MPAGIHGYDPFSRIAAIISSLLSPFLIRYGVNAGRTTIGKSTGESRDAGSNPAILRNVAQLSVQRLSTRFEMGISR
jgi:hypothetical protein